MSFLVSVLILKQITVDDKKKPQLKNEEDADARNANNKYMKVEGDKL